MLTDQYRLMLDVFGFVRAEKLIGIGSDLGRPAKGRVSQAHAFLGEGELDLSSRRELVERLLVDARKARLPRQVFGEAVPSEAICSDAFVVYAERSLSARWHEDWIERTLGEHQVEHTSRESPTI